MEFQELYWFIEYYYNQVAFFCYFHIKYLLHTHQNPRDYFNNYYLEQESFLISAINIKNFKDLLPDCILYKDNYHKLGVIHFLLHLNNYRIEFFSPLLLFFQIHSFIHLFPHRINWSNFSDGRLCFPVWILQYL